MTRFRKNLILFALILALTFTLFSCMPKPEETAEETETSWTGKEEFELPELDTKLDDRYSNYESTLPLAFSQTLPAPSSAFEFEESDIGITVKKYIGEDDIVMIPSEINEKAVTVIAENAFADTHVRALYIPDSVTVIEKGALADMDSLVTLRVPFIGGETENHFGYAFGCSSYSEHTVKLPPQLDVLIVGQGSEIGENAFAGCKSLSAIVLPESIEKIGKFAFYECADLVYVSIGENVKTIDNFAFGYCSSLRNFDTKNAETLGFGAFYEANGLTSLTVPYVGGSATENRYIGYIFGAELPDYNDEFTPHSLRRIKVTGSFNIPDRAFAGCAYIQNITLSEDISEIGIRAFYACRSLKSITLPKSLKTIKPDAFFACDGLESVEFNDQIEKIGMQAFFACKSLNNIKIPSSVKEIEACAFADCASLSSVNIGSDVKLGKDVFLNCPYNKGID